MRYFLLLSLLFSGLSSSSIAKLLLPSSVHNNSSRLFLEHSGGGRFSSYLAMDVNFSPIEDLFKQFSIEEKLKLKNRGEAHITVITPVEYYDTLREKITIEEINKIAQDLGIQSSKFSASCIGRGTVKLDGESESTYYVVVSSKSLIRIRKEVERLFISRGGDRSKFFATNYHPHITLGYTKRDLHESDGVIKDLHSCYKDITIK